jgi:DNA-binding NarL/FixJ family response regulator
MDVRRVLVCDDAESSRRLLRTEFAFHPELSVVAEAANGAEAVLRAAQCRPDVILLDLKMPIMDGFEALPRLLQAVPNAKVIVLSTMDDAEARRRVLDLGALAFISKGTSAEDLASTLIALQV